MGTITYLLVLFMCLTAGMVAARWVIPDVWAPAVDKTLGVCLYLLLFFMGVRTGLIDDISSKLSMIGVLALLFALSSAAGSAFVVILLGEAIRRKARQQSAETPRLTGQEEPSGDDGTSLSGAFPHLREPLRLLLAVLLGSLLAALTPMFSWFSDSVTNVLLYTLLFLVGIQMVQSDTDMIRVFRDPMSIILPVGTVVGTLCASCIIPLFTDIDLFESLAIASGFGWYSLSGVLITELGDPVLGSVAFLSNLFRESIAFFTIPLLAGYGRPHAAISVCGATSMDVTLPSIERSCGAAYVPLSIAHGVLLTLVVPFLVPLFYVWA